MNAVNVSRTATHHFERKNLDNGYPSLSVYYRGIPQLRHAVAEAKDTAAKVYATEPHWVMGQGLRLAGLTAEVVMLDDIGEHHPVPPRDSLWDRVKQSAKAHIQEYVEDFAPTEQNKVATYACRSLRIAALPVTLPVAAMGTGVQAAAGAFCQYPQTQTICDGVESALALAVLPYQIARQSIAGVIPVERALAEHVVDDVVTVVAAGIGLVGKIGRNKSVSLEPIRVNTECISCNPPLQYKPVTTQSTLAIAQSTPAIAQPPPVMTEPKPRLKGRVIQPPMIKDAEIALLSGNRDLFRQSIEELIDLGIPGRSGVALKMRNGYVGDSPSTYQDIANSMNVSSSRARQLCLKAERKIASNPRLLKEIFELIKEANRKWGDW